MNADEVGRSSRAGEDVSDFAIMWWLIFMIGLDLLFWVGVVRLIGLL